MPLYEYQCEDCGHRFERIVKFSDPPIETCPSCGGRVHKQISSPAFQFKGTGWYITDYAKKDSGGGKDKAGKSETNDSKSEKSDATTESKSESKDSASKDSSSDKSASKSKSGTSSGDTPKGT